MPGHYAIMSRDFVYTPLKIVLYNLEEIRIVHPNHYETEYSILCSPQVPGHYIIMSRDFVDIIIEMNII